MHFPITEGILLPNIYCFLFCDALRIFFAHFQIYSSCLPSLVIDINAFLFYSVELFFKSSTHTFNFLQLSCHKEVCVFLNGAGQVHIIYWVVHAFIDLKCRIYHKLQLWDKHRSVSECLLCPIDLVVFLYTKPTQLHFIECFLETLLRWLYNFLL